MHDRLAAICASLLLLTATPAVAAEGAAAAPQTVNVRNVVTVVGKVSRVGDRAFDLSYPGGTVAVDMNAWDRSPAEIGVRAGEVVVARGSSDGSFYDMQRLTAVAVSAGREHHSALGVDLGTGVDRAVLDEELVRVGSTITLEGEVVRAVDERVDVAVGDHVIRVDVSNVDENSPGVRRRERRAQFPLMPGDQVRITGSLEHAFFTNSVLDADQMVVLSRSANSPPTEAGSAGSRPDDESVTQ